jgi:tetratricopeptide (TPR) repeat protein
VWNSSLSFDPLVSTWLSTTKGSRVDAGISVQAALSKARKLVRSLESTPTVRLPAADRDTIDVLYAVCRLLESSCPDVTLLEAVYNLVATTVWTDDPFSEQDHILADVAYLAWNANRQRGWVDGVRWHRLCLDAVERQETPRGFLRLSCDKWSSGLCERFLSSRAVLLAACATLEKERNTRPQEVLAGALKIFEWLASALEAPGVAEDLVFFAGDVAYSAAVCFRHLGQFRAHDRWLDVAAKLFMRTGLPDPYLTRIKWSNLVARYDRHEYDVYSAIPPLTAAFHGYGMTDDERRSIFFEAHALKTLGRFRESRLKFESAKRSAEIAGDARMLGSSLVGIAENMAQLGEPAAAMRMLEIAAGVLTRGRMPMALASLHGVAGEVLKNEGNLNGAISEYQKSIATYEKAGCSFQVAYMQLVLADTLVAAGREAEAIRVLAEAFPVIEREGAEVDAVAAIGLLRESLRRQIAISRMPPWLRDYLGSCRVAPDA